MPKSMMYPLARRSGIAIGYFIRIRRTLHSAKQSADRNTNRNANR
ncbi:MAG: hypothetical protein ACI9B8_003708, partial [Sulfitobacter sp.]